MRNYEKKCKHLFELCGQKKIKLEFNKNCFEPQRLDCIWYGGHIATLSRDDVKVDISAIGDVRALLLDKKGNELVYVKDKGNAGRFYDEMSHYIKDDKQLNSLIEKQRLVFDNNNWLEYDGIIGKEFIDLGMIYDNVIGSNNILEAIKEVVDRFDEVIEEIKEQYEN